MTIQIVKRVFNRKLKVLFIHVKASFIEDNSYDIIRNLIILIAFHEIERNKRKRERERVNNI
jgi:hypothetical protein